MRELGRGHSSPAAVSSRNPDGAEARGTNTGLRKPPGGKGELLRGMWWSGVRRNGRSTVRPRHLRSGGEKEAALVSPVAARVRVLGH
jgi:hypothetical protein